MGSQKTTSTQTYQPFTGEMYDYYKELLNHVQGQATQGSNQWSTYLDNLGAYQPDTSGIEQSRNYINNISNNDYVANLANGQGLDPLQNEYQLGAYNQALKDIQKSYGSMLDATNASFATGGFGNGSARQNAQLKNAQAVGNSQASFAADYLNQAYAQNQNLMLQANQLQNEWSNMLRQQGLDEYNLSQDEYNRQLQLFQQKYDLSNQDLANWANVVQMGANPTSTTTQKQSGGWASSLAGSLSGYALGKWG